MSRSKPAQPSSLKWSSSVPNNDRDSFFEQFQGRLRFNRICVDCKSENAQWASASFGTIICIQCSGHHRNLGVHLSFVRSIDMDTWTLKQLKTMELGGNQRFLAFCEEHQLGDLPIKSKYNDKRVCAYRETFKAELESFCESNSVGLDWPRYTAAALGSPKVEKPAPRVRRREQAAFPPPQPRQFSPSELYLDDAGWFEAPASPSVQSGRVAPHPVSRAAPEERSRRRRLKPIHPEAEDWAEDSRAAQDRHRHRQQERDRLEREQQREGRLLAEGSGGGGGNTGLTGQDRNQQARQGPEPRLQEPEDDFDWADGLATAARLAKRGAAVAGSAIAKGGQALLSQAQTSMRRQPDKNRPPGFAAEGEIGSYNSSGAAGQRPPGKPRQAAAAGDQDWSWLLEDSPPLPGEEASPTPSPVASSGLPVKHAGGPRRQAGSSSRRRKQAPLPSQEVPTQEVDDLWGELAASPASSKSSTAGDVDFAGFFA